MIPGWKVTSIKASHSQTSFSSVRLRRAFLTLTVRRGFEKCSALLTQTSVSCRTAAWQNLCQGQEQIKPFFIPTSRRFRLISTTATKGCFCSLCRAHCWLPKVLLLVKSPPTPLQAELITCHSRYDTAVILLLYGCGPAGVLSPLQSQVLNMERPHRGRHLLVGGVCRIFTSTAAKEKRWYTTLNQEKDNSEWIIYVGIHYQTTPIWNMTYMDFDTYNVRRMQICFMGSLNIETISEGLFFAAEQAASYPPACWPTDPSSCSSVSLLLFALLLYACSPLSVLSPWSTIRRRFLLEVSSC